MSDCPPRDRVLKVVCGSITSPDFGEIEAHIEACERCQELLEAMRSGTLDSADDLPGNDALPTLPDLELLERLGQGGMGVVFKARQHQLGRIVAVKLLLAGNYAEPHDRARFRREAEAAAQLHHPNIVQILQVGETGGMPFLILEYAEGGNLAERLQEMPLAERTAAQLMETLACAVEFIHSHNIIHRDLKPANILLSGVPGAALDAPLLKISDFGLARRLGAPSSTQSRAMIGTPSYMAPEQADGKSVDARTDVYALGAILYQMLTGRPPFHADSSLETLEQVRSLEPILPRHVQPRIARDLETICLKCLQKDPRRRYPTASALAADLRRFLDGRPVAARPVGSLEHGWRWCRRKPLVAGLLAGLVLVMAAGFSVSFVSWRRAEAQAARAEISEAAALASLHKEEAARQEAEEQYVALCKALRSIIEHTSPQQLLTAGTEPLREQVLMETESWLSRLIEGREKDIELRILRAIMLTQLGATRVSQNRGLEGQSFLERSAKEWECLQTEGHCKPDDRVWMAITYGLLSQVCERRQSDRAQESMASALRIWQGLLREPAHHERDHLGIGYVVAGNGSSVEVARRLEKIRQQVNRPGTGLECDLLVDLARVAYLLSDAEKHGWTEQSPRVVATVREAAGILKKLVLRTPHEPNTCCQLTYIGLNVSAFLRRAGASEEALDLCEGTNRVLQGLVQEAPREGHLLEALSSSWIQIAKTRWDLKQPDEALGAFRSALAAQRQAFALAPEAPGSRWELDACYRHLGRRLCELGRLDEAEACFKERLALGSGDVDWQAKVLGELRHWAAQLGEDVSTLSPARQQERQRYLDLCARLEWKGVKDSVSVAGKTP